MRIFYVSHARFPTEKAHGIQIAQVCSAIAALGHELTLLRPQTRHNVHESPFAYYGIPENFRMETMRSFDALQSSFIPGKLAFAVSMWSYGRALQKYIRKTTPDLLYIRSPILLAPLAGMGIPLVLELHTLPRYNKSLFTRCCNKCRLVVCLTTPMRDELVSWGVDPKRVTVEGDGLDPDRFGSLPGTSTAKMEWKLPADRPVLGYVGSLATQDTIEKGVREFIDALALLKRQGKSFFGWIVGGPEGWKRRYEQHAASFGLTERDIRFEGPITSPRVPSALAAIDICIYPAPASDHPFFQRDTSPLKLFEYLASGKPIVCADLPPVRDIVDESLVHFCTPGDSQSLADAAVRAMEQPIINAGRRSELIDHYAWRKRMERILQRI